MSGIAGVFSGAYAGVAKSLLPKMLNSMQHRGADGNECDLRGTLWIGACRRNPLGPDCGGRVAYSETLDKYAVCDGYIYNRRELRARLEEGGHRFRSESEAEAVVHLYEEHGGDFAESLRGDFAAAVVSGQTLTLTRDRFGMKPLYYLFLEQQNLFLFASEVKALLQYEEFTPRLDEEKLAEYLLPRFALGNKAFIKGVKSVSPGHTLVVTEHDGQLRIEEREYYRLSFETDDSITLDDAKRQVEELLVEAVGSYLARAGDVGLALSGGVDSSLLALTAHKYYGKKLITYTIGQYAEDQDLLLARVIAGRIGSEHHEIITDFQDFLAEIPHIVHAMECPVIAPGSAFGQLCGVASKRLKFCLIGEAADEVFGGGEHHLSDRQTRENLGQGLRRASECGLVLRDEVRAIVSDLCDAESYEQYVANQHRIGLADRFTYAMQYYHSVSMSKGLELADPFLHHGLIDFMRRVPMKLKARRDLWIDKYLLRVTALGMFGPSMYDAVLCRKRGLGGVGEEFVSRFTRMCDAALPDSYLSEHPFGAYFPQKSHLLLIDLFNFIFIENRGQCPDGLDILGFINSRTPAGTSLSYKRRRGVKRRGINAASTVPAAQPPAMT